MTYDKRSFFYDELHAFRIGESQRPGRVPQLRIFQSIFASL